MVGEGFLFGWSRGAGLAFVEQQLPSQHAAAFIQASAKGEIAAAGRRDARRVARESDERPATEQPEQAGAVDAGKGFCAVAPEQVERRPAQPLCTIRPAVVEEASAVVDELNPAQNRHVARRASWIKPCHSFRGHHT